MQRTFNSNLITVLLLPFFFGGCASVLVTPLLEPLSLSLQQQQDIALLKDGAPTLLLMIDGFIATYPENEKLVLDGTRAYSAYASALAEFGEMERAVMISGRAKEYGLKLLSRYPAVKNSLSSPIDKLEKSLQTVKKDGIDYLFWGAYGWATWISLQNGSPAAVADLPRVEKIMLRVLELDDAYYYGAPHVFLGYYYGSIPVMLGGKPEASRRHFDKALKISDHNFLSAQVAYAESYARLQFDRDLFLGLLNEVLTTPADAVTELTASNQLAKKRARKLLKNID